MCDLETSRMGAPYIYIYIYIYIYDISRLRVNVLLYALLEGCLSQFFDNIFSLEKENGGTHGRSPPIAGFEYVDSCSLFITEFTQTPYS